VNGSITVVILVLLLLLFLLALFASLLVFAFVVAGGLGDDNGFLGAFRAVLLLSFPPLSRRLVAVTSVCKLSLQGSPLLAFLLLLGLEINEVGALSEEWFFSQIPKVQCFPFSVVGKPTF
jgi:hypothetical protein